MPNLWEELRKERTEENPLANLEFEEFFTNPKLYLCGEPVDKVLGKRFFDSLNYYVKCGLCYGQAALAMFLLKDNPSARLVQGWGIGTRDQERHRHAWAECEYNGAWCVVDFAWIPWECVPMPKEMYYELTAAEPLWVCESREFWRDSYNRLNFERCQDPKTSWILPQLMADYMPDPYEDEETATGFDFPSEKSCLRNDERYGETMIPQAFYFTTDGGAVSQRVVRELMAKPGPVSPRTRWKAAYQQYRLSERIGIIVRYPV